MIVISSRLDDISTSNVIDWLNYQGKKYIRFNGDSLDTLFSYRDGALNIESPYYNNSICLENIESFWYRKCGLNLDSRTTQIECNNFFLYKTDNICRYVSDHASQYCLSEFKAYRDFVFSYLENHSSKSLGCYKLRELNKVEILVLANEIGLFIPKTYILNNKGDLEKVIAIHKHVIVKPLYEGVYDIQDENAFVSYTSLIKEEDLTGIPVSFPPALFQEEIEKQFEIRVIYISGECFSVAMFTQEHESSQIDGRRCPQEVLRMTPYTLPENIENLIKQLMMKIGLSYGALDIILSEKNEYIFLEINPVGQYSAYGTACNYYLDKIISEQL